MPDNSIRCHLCKSDEHYLIKKSGKESWNICKACCLLFHYPSVDIKDNMSKNLRYKWGDADRDDENQYLKEVTSAGNTWRRFEELFNQTLKGRLLDFGSGTGPLLEYHKNSDVEATGVEPSQRNSEFSRQRGHKTKTGFLEPGLFENDSFEMIHFQNSMLYVPNLGDTFSLFHDLLSTDGLILWKDNQYHFSAKNAGRHIGFPGPAQYFSTTSAMNTLRYAGFKKVRYYDVFGEFYLIAQKSAEREHFTGSAFVEKLWVKSLPLSDVFFRQIFRLALKLQSFLKRSKRGRGKTP